MGKSKKKKNKDFQKVKLKVGRTLKKADNVTDASFKSRSVQVVQNLKGNSETEPSTRRKQNINDLLSQFQHYNITVRHDAITGLRELLTSHQELMTSHLSIILERASELFSDKDPAVRQAVIRLLKIVLTKINIRNVSPFFPVISAHLCCAMTHIYDDIQADSLQILDLFLDYLPSLVVNKSSQLLPNFIEQISRQKSEGSRKGRERSLKVNPNSKMASQRWRTGVLKRLQKLLVIIMDQNVIAEDVTRNKHSSDADHVIQWSEEKCTNFQPYPKTFQSSWSLTSSTYKLSSRQVVASVNDKKDVTVFDEEGLKKFVTTIIPLLLDCWIESSPPKQFSSNKDEGSLLSADALSLRINILSVIQLLWQYISDTYPSQIVWLRKTYFGDFQNHFLKCFPYSVHETLGKKDKKEKSAQNPKVSSDLLNLAICDVMTYFLWPSSEEMTSLPLLPWQSVVIDYVMDAIRGQTDSTQVKTVIEILPRLMNSDLPSDYIMEVLSVTLHRYMTVHPLSFEKKYYLEFLSDVMLSPEYDKYASTDVKKAFLQSLPELFIHVCKNNQQMAAHILSVMKRAACQNCQEFLYCLLAFMKNVMENKLLMDLQLTSQYRLVELLFYIPSIDRPCLSMCARMCRNQRLSDDIGIYLLQILQQRYDRMTDRSIEDTALHISFLLSVLLGNDESDMQEVVDDLSGRKKVIISRNRESWNRCNRMIKAVCEQFQHFVNTFQVIELINTFLLSYLNSRQTLQAEVVNVFVSLANGMKFYNYPISEDLTQSIVEVIWSYFSSSVLLLPTITEDVKDSVTDLIDSLITDCMLYIIKTDKGSEKFLNLLLQLSTEVDVEGFSHICKTGSVLLQRVEARSAIQSQCPKFFHSLVFSVKTKFPDISNHQWGADFLYLASLVT